MYTFRSESYYHCSHSLAYAALFCIHVVNYMQ